MTTVAGVDLTSPQKPNVIVANIDKGVPSCQVFQITVKRLDAGKTPPTIGSTIPIDSATGVAIDSTIAATFSKTVDPAILTAAPFLLKKGSTAF